MGVLQSKQPTTDTAATATAPLPARLQECCFKKCIHKAKDVDLHVGEMSCVDRCVGKYMAVHDKVGDVFKKMQAEMNGQQAAQQ